MSKVLEGVGAPPGDNSQNIFSDGLEVSSLIQSTDAAITGVDTTAFGQVIGSEPSRSELSIAWYVIVLEVLVVLI